MTQLFKERKSRGIKNCAVTKFAEACKTFVEKFHALCRARELALSLSRARALSLSRARALSLWAAPLSVFPFLFLILFSADVMDMGMNPFQKRGGAAASAAKE
jgi:hypothetical protein